METPWYQPFISIDTSLPDKVLRTAVVYLAIVVLLRVAGKRLLAQMDSLDLVVVLLLSNVVQNAIIGPDNSVLGAVVGAVVLIGFDWVLSWVADHSAWARRVLEGRYSTIITDGRPNRRALARLGIDDRELASALRHQGVNDVAQVRTATIETDGAILVDLKLGERTVTKDDLAAAVADLKKLIAASGAGH